ncbi:MAG: hypothetical protein KDD50_13815, partial [Bdellovibrionales bacterium]|nr:hypothetical protein [Bdellovibrionales bacterium]
MKNKKTEKLIDKVRLIFLFTGIALGIYYMIFDYLNKKSFENTYFLFSCIVVLCLAIVLHYKGKTQLANFFYLIPAQSFMTFLIY